MYSCKDCSATENMFGYPFKIPADDTFHVDGGYLYEVDPTCLITCEANPHLCLHHDSGSGTQTQTGIDGYW